VAVLDCVQGQHRRHPILAGIGSGEAAAEEGAVVHATTESDVARQSTLPQVNYHKDPMMYCVKPMPRSCARNGMFPQAGLDRAGKVMARNW